MLPGSASSLGNASLICCVNVLFLIGISAPSLPPRYRSTTGTASGSDTQPYTLNNNNLQQHHPLTNPHLTSCITVATCNVKACPSPKPLSSENRSRDSYLFCFTANFQVSNPTSFSSSLSLSPSHVATASLPCPIRLEPGFIVITQLDKS
jgi:hypothetical protein